MKRVKPIDDLIEPTTREDEERSALAFLFASAPWLTDDERLDGAVRIAGAEFVAEILADARVNEYAYLARAARRRPRQYRAGIETRMRRIWNAMSADERARTIERREEA